jgi:asparagine synthase (glutamine-hydrolysing)
MSFPEALNQILPSEEDGLERQFGFIPRFVHVPNGMEHPRLIEIAKAASSLSLDYGALNTFLRAGLFFNGATPFREIRRICPAPVLTQPIEISRSAAIDAYIDLFDQAVRRRVSQRTVLALSGGADSRHILLALHAQKALPEYVLTVAIPGRPSEVRIAAQITERALVPHRITAPLPRRAFADERWKNEACDFMSLEHGWFSHVGQQRDQLGWWDGIAGDVLSAGLFLEDWNLELVRQNRLDELADRLVQTGPVPYFRDQSLFVRTDAVHAVRAELAKHQQAPNPVGSFYFWNRTRIQIGACAFGLLSPHGQPVLTPYLDRELWSFLSSLPAEMLVDRKLHTDAIARGYPDFADIPYFKDKVSPDPALIRSRALSLFTGLLTCPSLNLEWPNAMVRSVRSLLDAQYRASTDWLLPCSVFGQQIESLVKK